jgi:hypothetical protein
MNMNEIKIIARERGIKTGSLKKSDLIKAIQRQEGNSDCFGDVASVACEQTGCLWFGDCQPG